jgi:hypothetical protein
MIAYRDLLSTMIILFIVLSIIISPAFFFFKSYNGIDKSLAKPYVTYSLGNMGYATTECSISPLGAGD